MDLLTNAIKSIRVAVEDWQVGTRPRLLSTVRNIHAGILLLYKEALLRLSPPDSAQILIKARIKPVSDRASTVRFVGAGRKTVDSQQIRERFDSLGITTDWNRFKGISDVRNDIEHYFADVTHDSLRGVIASAFLIIRNFCIDQLKEEPRQLLGQDTWDVMLEAADVYAAERLECDQALQAVAWESAILEDGIRELRCDECSSDLLRPEGGDSYSAVSIRCRSCGAVKDFEEFIPQAVAAALEWESYVAATDGGESPIAECPECGSNAYVMEEGRCAMCGSEAEHECSRCGCSIPASEMSCSPLCGYCEHVMSKDD